MKNESYTLGEKFCKLCHEEKFDNIDISTSRHSIKRAGIMTSFSQTKKYLICNMKPILHSLPGKNKQNKNKKRVIQN